ncbi:MAG: Anucleate primary sterigmata protein B [Pycnora praestabilis]|nr:MAG: Anucleate primary sterigmata protein B [Pycnora praestabilis]
MSLSLSSSRPSTARQDSQSQSRLPGGFDDDDELSPVESEFRDSVERHDEYPSTYHDSSPLPPLPQGDSSVLPAPSEDGANRTDGDLSGYNEREMRRKLMDLESSFLPDASPTGTSGGTGADNTFIFGASKEMGPPPHPSTYRAQDTRPKNSSKDMASTGEPKYISQSPPTPPESYQTPAPPCDESPQADQPSVTRKADNDDLTSSLESMSSSPTAAAAVRTISRVTSMATLGGYETADDRHAGSKVYHSDEGNTSDEVAIPQRMRKRAISQTSSQSESTPKVNRSKHTEDEDRGVPESSNGTFQSDSITRERQQLPNFLRSRQASQRSSASSFTTRSDFSGDGASDITLGADFALQSGGAAPSNNSLTRPGLALSRATSLGSIASGITPLSEGSSWWDRSRLASGTFVFGASATGTLESNLSRLDEEDRVTREEQAFEVKGTLRGLNGGSSPPATPRASSRTLTAPTDTVIAQHVRNIHVPASVAREYRENNRPVSPEKRTRKEHLPPGRGGKNLTLREQTSTIDRLTNENFDLKLKIHFLSNALNERSEEGVKDMVSENVELKAGLVKLQKDTKALRRTVRDLERKLKEKEDGMTAAAGAIGASGEGKRLHSPDQGATQEMEEEIFYLRERIETYEVEVEKLRSECLSREGEKRRLAGLVKSMGERNSTEGDLGAREEMDMWKDLLEAETARREQSDEDNRKLQEEVWRLKNDASSTASNNQTSNVHVLNKHQNMPNSQSQARPNGSDQGSDRYGADSAASSTLVEQLRHENAELRREVGAQTSMLTSRNREKERLYQEIEDLKIGQRRGDSGRSVAGDSILERSASRAHQRSASRASAVTGVTQMSDAEREDLENKNGALRDRISELKLKNQELENKLGECVDELEQSDVVRAELETLVHGYEDDIDVAVQDLQTMQAERNESLKLREQLEVDFENLKTEAQQELDKLEDELENKDEQSHQLQTELDDRNENFKALQNEMRSMSEGLVRLEDDHEANGRRAESLQQELQDANKELENLEKSLMETNQKNERLTVQQESSQGEIAFLREEQDGDKIKIGNLETAIKTLEASLREEKGRGNELDERLAEERHQREVVGGKEKQEVQRIINDLNREVSSSRDEARRLRKSVSSREVEAAEWKERLMELENNLREALGDLNGTRSSLLKSITKLQKELDTTVSELDSTKNDLAEKVRLLKTRDALLESTGLESQKLSDLLEKERQGRRADKHNFEITQKTHQQSTRTITQHETRVTELETARQQDKKKIFGLEQRFKDQLLERNNLLLAMWNRLSTMCGTEWSQKNSLVNEKTPSLEVIATTFPGFSKNLILAMKTVEGLIGGFKGRIRGVERDLWKDYQTLEHNLDVRTKKLDRLEGMVLGANSIPRSSSPEVKKLRGENRLLKAEINVMQKNELHSRAARSDPRASFSEASSRDATRAAMAATLMRHHSSSAVETLERAGTSNAVPIQSAPIEPSQQRWIHRLRELERRLKAEREARLLDRSGARKRLEEGKAENEELRMELERERMRKEG